MFGLAGMVHHNLVVNGPLNPTFPEGWVGPQGTWTLKGTMNQFSEGIIGNEIIGPMK